MTLRGPVTALLLVSVMAGCTQPQPEDSAAPTVRTSFPTPLGAVSSLEDLRAAAVSAGMDCVQLTHDSGVYASESGHCTSKDRLQVYESESGLKEDVEYLTKNVPGSTLLVGPNWMINTDQAEHLRTKLGGAVLTSETGMAAPTRVDIAPETQSYGPWYEFEGLKVKMTTPKRLAKDDVCSEYPWKTTMTVKNTGKKARHLSDINLFGLRDDHDPLVYALGDQRFVPGEIVSIEDPMIAPGATQTFRIGLCPVYLEFDASTPLTLQILGYSTHQNFTLAASS